MSEVALRPNAELSEASLEELALIAANEYRATAEHLAGALGHFVRLGEVLLEARGRIDSAGIAWISWLRTVGIEHHFTADRAMRLAFYRDQLPDEAFSVRRDAAGRLLNPSWNNALHYLRGLPAIHTKGRTPYTDDLKREARRLRAEGLTFRQISEVLEVGTTTIRAWLDSDFARRQNELKRERKKARNRQATLARRAQQRSERDSLARQVGGDPAVAYADLRKALVALDRFCTNVTSPTSLAAARRAIGQMHSAENSIVEVLQELRMEGHA